MSCRRCGREAYARDYRGKYICEDCAYDDVIEEQLRYEEEQEQEDENRNDD